MIKKKKANRRYYLHRKIRKQGYNLNTGERTIFVPYTQTDYSKHVLILRDIFQYGIQTKIV